MNKDSGYTFPSNAVVNGTLKVKGRDILEELDAIKAKTNNITGDVNGISKLLFTGDVIMYQDAGIRVRHNKAAEGTWSHLYVDGANNVQIFTVVKGAVGLDMAHNEKANYIAINNLTTRNSIDSHGSITATGNITATGTINATDNITCDKELLVKQNIKIKEGVLFLKDAWFGNHGNQPLWNDSVRNWGWNTHKR